MPTNAQLIESLKEIDKSDYAVSHYERFVESYNFIAPYIQKGMRILDLGSYGHFQKLVQHFHPDVVVDKSELFDLRYGFPIEPGTYDIVCFMEVLEHIKDRNEDDDIDKLAEFDSSGVKNVMSEIQRILKDGGLLFLTTPNINSWMAIHRALMYYSPTFYLPHVKEYSVKEIAGLMSCGRFELKKLETVNCHGAMSVEANCDIVNTLRAAVSNIPYGLVNRGDCIFALSEKR